MTDDSISSSVPETHQSSKAYRLLRLLTENLSSLIAYVDTAGVYRFNSRTYEAMLGLPASQLVGRSIREVIGEDSYARIEPYIRTALSGRKATYYTTLLMPDGKERYLHGLYLPDIDEDGQVAGFVAIVEDLTERRRAEEEAQRQVQRQRTFVREVLYSVTEGKLRLCDAASDLPARLKPVSESIGLTHESLQVVRHAVGEAARARGFDAERCHDLVIAVGEAAMNAVVHANTGTACVHSDGDATLQIWVEDHGSGIAMDYLHRATLERGFTTAGSMGHGFWLILKTIDRVWLLTGATGTTVVLEQRRDAPGGEEFWFPGIAPL